MTEDDNECIPLGSLWNEFDFMESALFVEFVPHTRFVPPLVSETSESDA